MPCYRNGTVISLYDVVLNAGKVVGNQAAIINYFAQLPSVIPITIGNETYNVSITTSEQLKSQSEYTVIHFIPVSFRRWYDL
jgi:hypothetical protein